MATLKITQVTTKKLAPYERNARTHSKEQIEQLRKSIREFGFINPILIDSKNVIIAGHARCEAAKLEGLESLPCIYVEHLSEAQKRAYIIADNKLAMNAGWDFGLLASELLDVQGCGLLDTIGFANKDIEHLLGGQEEATENEGEDDGPAPESSAREINTETFKFEHKCPRCGFEFDNEN